jgi:hypothetical protein
MLKRHTFITCFAVSLLPFLAVNLSGYIAAPECCTGDSYTEAGFPIPWYTSGGFVAPPHIIREALIADALIIVGISYAGGRILASVFQPNR